MGERVGPNWIVTEGLKPGERVVVEGILKVQQFAAAVAEIGQGRGSRRCQAVRAACSSSREQLTMSKFFINRPIVAIVIAILMVLVGVVAMLESAYGTVSQYRRPHDPGEGHLSRRGRADHCRIGGDSH